MATLDARGDIAAAVIAAYSLIFLVILVLVLRYGIGKSEAWFSVILFSLFRVIGGATTVAVELDAHPSEGLIITSFVFQSVGFAALLTATISFLGIVGINLADNPRRDTKLSLQVVFIPIMAGIVLAVVGAVKLSDSSESDRNTATTLRKAGSILLLVAYVMLALFHILYWRTAARLADFQRMLLTALTIALVPLAVRLVYNVLSAFSPAPVFTSTGIISSNPSASLAKFNSFTGSWAIYLVMFVIMELLVVLIYVAAGVMLPIDMPDNNAPNDRIGARKDVVYGNNTDGAPSTGYEGYRGPQTNQVSQA